MPRINWTVRKRRLQEYWEAQTRGGSVLATHRPWSKKELKARIAELHAKGEKLPADRVLLETSMFGKEIKPNTVVTACLNHPKRTTFAQLKIDADENIVAVK